ncbi:MAG TPA: RDD family protein, partial [Acidimicrobiales bacterium]
LIWSLVIWRSGETPAMQIMRIKVVKLDTGEVAPYGTMFLREFVGKWVIMGLIASIFFPAWVVLVFMLMWDKNRQELWDKMAGTIVVSNYPEPVQVGDANGQAYAGQEYAGQPGPGEAAVPAQPPVAQ